MIQNCLKALAAVSLIAATSLPALATPINANTGWIPENLTSPDSPTVASPFTFSLTAGQTASFKVTDYFIVGDSFQLFSGGMLLAESTAYAGASNAIVGDSFGEQGWLSSAYEKIDYVFSGAGDYSFTIVGDGVGGIPAGLYLRLDVIDAAAVPEPVSFALLGLGVVALSAARCRKN